MRQIWFLNQSIELESVRFRSVLLPHSSGNRGKNSLSHAVVSLFLGSDPSVSNSNMFLFLSSSRIPQFKESLLRVPINHKAHCRLYEMFVRACVATKCNAHAWQRLSGKLGALSALK